MLIWEGFNFLILTLVVVEHCQILTPLLQIVNPDTILCVLPESNFIFSLASFLDFALSNRISDALSDLSEKKRIRVLVSPDQVEITQKLLADTPMWEVAASNDVRGGAIFQLEKEKWDTRIQLAIDETIQLIQAWIEE